MFEDTRFCARKFLAMPASARGQWCWRLAEEAQQLAEREPHLASIYTEIARQWRELAGHMQDPALGGA